MSAPELIRSEALAFPIPVAKLHEIMVNFCMMEFEARGECDPTYVIQIPGNLLWLKARFENEREKYATSEALHYMLQKFGALSYSFAIEAYVSVYSKEELESANFVLPSRKQQRDEVLMIVSCQRYAEAPIYSRFLINPRPNGKTSYLGPRVDEDQQFAGMLMNLFKTREERMTATDKVTGAQI